VCDVVPGYRCLSAPEVDPEKIPLAPPPATQPPLAASVHTTRNNDKYIPYLSFTDEPWFLTVNDIQSLPLKAYHFNPLNLIGVLTQRAKIPYIVRDVLTGYDVRNGGIVWGPTETKYVHSRYIGIGYGHLFFVGRELPPYYQLKTEVIAKARYSVFAVDTATGLTTASYSIPQTLYIDNIHKNSLLCMTEVGNAIFVLEGNSLLIFKIEYTNNKLSILPGLSKQGYPVAHQNQGGTDVLDKCSIVSDDAMAYLGVEPSDTKKKLRLIKVNTKGDLVWGAIPANEMASSTIYSRVSTFPNGTSLVGGSAFYIMVDKDGKGVPEKHSGNRYGTFALGINGKDAVSYGTDTYAPQDVAIPKNFNLEPLIHEEYHKIIHFKAKGTGGRIYNMNGVGFINMTKCCFDWEFQDYVDRTFFIDSLMTINYVTTYPTNQYIELQGFNISKAQFGL